MKLCTNISQSKALVEILPRESANMCYLHVNGTYFCDIKDGVLEDEDIPAWSLAALLNVLPSSTLDSSDDHYYRVRCRERFTEWHDNAVDACVEMILKLHEQMIDDFNNEERL